MGSFSVTGVNFSNYGWGTWTTRFYFTFNMSGLSSPSYDIKYFYHVVGGSDPEGHRAWMNPWNGSDSFSIQLYPRQTYVFQFELWDTYNNQNTGAVLSGYTIVIPGPPILFWSWNNDTGSYNQVNKNDNSSYLTASRDAVSQTGNPTVDFKRQTWNDLIDWLIYVYKQATNSTVNDEFFYPSGSTGRAYLTSVQSHPDPIIFRANNWNLMSYIGNYAAIALGGSSFISQVSTGDKVESHIFSDVIDEINRLIRIYNANLQS